MRDVGAVLSLTDYRPLHCRKDSVEKSLEAAARSPRGRRFPDAEHFRLADVEGGRLAAIVYTSGTTGFSKGVMLPHRSLLANVVFAQENMPLEPGDTIVSFLPLAHAFGCAFEFLFPFMSGCAITFLAQTPSPKVILGVRRRAPPPDPLGSPRDRENLRQEAGPPWRRRRRSSS